MGKQVKNLDLSDVSWIDISLLILFLVLALVQLQKMGILKTIERLLFPLT